MREYLVSLGQKLKSIRKSKKMTLQEFAEKAGLSAGLISRIENFRTLPSLVVLVRISAALGINMTELFEGITFEDHPRWKLIRAGEAKKIDKEGEGIGMNYFMLTETGESARSCIWLVEVEPWVKRPPVTTAADEMLYIVSGDLEYHLGVEKLELHKGDLLFFDGEIPHYPVNQTQQTATMLVCFFMHPEKNG